MTAGIDGLDPGVRADSWARLRRANALVATWESGRFLVRNYLSGRRTQIEPIAMQVLDRFGEYRSGEQAREILSGIPGAEGLLARFVKQHILLQEGSALDVRDRRLDSAWVWGHETRFFHWATRDVPYEQDMRVQRESLLRLAAEEPPPSPFMSTGGVQTCLPGDFNGLDTSLGATLLNRRTRRDFSRAPLPLEQFGRVLRWTWGKTRLVEDGAIGPYVLKTSPSGGARHSIEVYPLVARVQGVEPGVYHYSMRNHALELVEPGLRNGSLEIWFAGQPWLRDAAAVFVMTSVVARSQWKYRHGHALRVLLLDAGHLGQTFHLVCTALGLAPFTLAGFHDSSLEAALRIDGVDEILLYAAAVGLPARVEPEGAGRGDGSGTTSTRSSNRGAKPGSLWTPVFIRTGTRSNSVSVTVAPGEGTAPRSHSVYTLVGKEETGRMS